jgi:putative resolvase
VAYCRVSSSQTQKSDLLNQKAALEQWCEHQQIRVDEWIMEVGGGLNFEREQFLRLVDGIIDGQIERVVLAHQDRLVRFGSKLLVHLCRTHQTELLIMDTEALSPEQELVQDLLTITHCFSSRLPGLRNYRKALKEALRNERSAQDQVLPDA